MDLAVYAESSSSSSSHKFHRVLGLYLVLGLETGRRWQTSPPALVWPVGHWHSPEALTKNDFSMKLKLILFPLTRPITIMPELSYHFTEFTEATRTTGGLSKHRQKPYNAYYPNN